MLLKLDTMDGIRSTSVMTGAHEASFHCEVHSCCLEQLPEHQPQLMKRGALKQMEHVKKCAHPGPAEGTLNILIKERGGRGWGEPHVTEKDSQKVSRKTWINILLGIIKNLTLSYRSTQRSILD